MRDPSLPKEKTMNVYIKVIGTHALIVGGVAAAATVVRDIIVLSTQK